MKRLKAFLHSPVFYNFIQRILAGAGSAAISKKLVQYLQFKAGDPVLDVGCGTGKYSGLFRGADYVGVDVSDRYLEYPRDKYPFAKFLAMSAVKLNFPDGVFRYVFCVSTFHHLSDREVAVAAEEMKRVCRAGGSVYVVDNVWPGNPLGWLLFAADFGRHQRSFSKMEKIMTGLGFEVIDNRLSAGFPYRYAVFAYHKK